MYSLKCLPRTHFGEYVVLISCCCYRRAPTGRYSCLAQGASPGLGIEIFFLSPVGAAQPKSKCPTRAVSAAPTELILFIVCVYPGFCSCLWLSRHPGLWRSIALAGLIYVFTTNQLLCCFDALTLAHKAGQAYTFQLKQLPLQNNLCKVIINTYVRL